MCRGEVVRLLVESGANKDQGKTGDGMTPLHIAAEQGHLEVVRFLVESGANKDQGTTDYGTTPLCMAAHNGHLDVVRFLVESGANKDQGQTDIGARPLHIAAHALRKLLCREAKLSDFWLSQVPTKTKDEQILEQGLYTKQLTPFVSCFVERRSCPIAG